MESVAVCGKRFSKVVCGTNAFYGRSHFSDARDREYSSRCGDDYIREVIRKCLAFGVNAVESSASERIQKIIAELRDQSDTPVHFIGSTRVDDTSEMKTHQAKFRYLIERDADICVLHSQFVDRPRRSEEIRGLRESVQKIHDAGLIAGISTHQVSTVELCEAQQYGVDVYLFPLNLTGFVYPGYEGRDTVAERVRTVLSTPKPFLLMKVLGAGRIPPDEGLQFALENSKPSDAITLGLSSVAEAEESLQFVTDYLSQNS
jgi:hypothetical protein